MQEKISRYYFFTKNHKMKKSQYKNKNKKQITTRKKSLILILFTFWSIETILELVYFLFVIRYWWTKEKEEFLSLHG